MLLHANATDRGLSFITKAIFGIWLLRFLLPLHYLADFPSEIAFPTGILAWIPRGIFATMMSHQSLIQLRIIGAVACLACFRTNWLPIASVCAAIACTIEQSIVRSFGYQNHAEVPLLLATYTIAACAIIREYRPRSGADFNDNAPPLVLSTFLFMMTYALTGLTRLCDGSFDMYYGDMMHWCVLDHTHNDWAIPLPQFSGLSRGSSIVTLINLGFPAITILEILAPLVLVSVTFRRVFVVVMITFHLMNLLLMHFAFNENIAMLLLLCTGLSTIPSSESLALREKAVV